MTLPRWGVTLKPAVLDDLVAIGRHIEQWTGDRAAADRTVDAIRAFIAGLATAPHRGTRRDDLRPGLRMAPAGKRTAIAFEIDEAHGIVTILRVFHGGQDWEAVMRDP